MTELLITMRESLTYQRYLNICLISSILLFMGACGEHDKSPAKLPNIVIIFADDLGYGDLGSYNKNSLIPTPNLDKLAKQGIRLTDAYCPVSVCSPSRFALMTGSYPFRSWKKKGVMSNYEPSMIPKGQLTLPQMLQEAGYTTAGFGKWHLGASFPTLDGKEPAGYGKFKAENNGANLDLNRPIWDGPVDHGFTHWYGFSCASECWIMEGQEIVAALEHEFYNIESAQNKEHIKNIPADTYLPLIVEKSTQFLEKHVATNEKRPFFLYFAPYVPHIPLSVGKKFRGTTKAGLYGDYVHELDTYIGQLLDTLDSLQQTENTIVLFASDNGSQFEVTSDTIDMTTASNSLGDVIKKGQDPNAHYPNGALRGTKWTAWEGGVRTPFIARWPGHFPKNVKSNQLFALNDVMATLASVIGFGLPNDTAMDSYDQLSVLMGKEGNIRKSVVTRSSKGRFGLREGQWKYLEPKDENTEGELYDLLNDISESENLFDKNSQLAEQMKETLKEIIDSKRTNTSESYR